MKNKKNLLMAVVTIASLSGSLSSCSENIPEDAVRLLNFKPEIANSYETIKTKFKEETGITLVVETAAEGNYETRLKEIISTDSAPSIFQINGPIGYKRWAQYCSDMSSTDIYNKLKDKSTACTVNGKAYGIPTTVEGYGIIYNKALTDKYFALESKTLPEGVSSMDDINSYEKLKAVVEDMQSHKSDLNIDGVFAPSGLDGSTSWRITGHAFNMALVGEFGNATETPTTIEFSCNEQYRRIIDLYVKNSTKAVSTMTESKWDEESASFASGKSIMVQNGIWATSDLIKGSVKAEDLRYLPLYCGDTENYKEATQGLCVGTEAYWTINAKANSKAIENSKTFLNWLFDGNGKQYAVNDLKFAPPFVGFTGDLASSDALSVEMNRWLSKEDKKSVPWDFPLVPSTDKQRAALVVDLKEYYNSNCSDDKWTQLVNNAKQSWANLAKNS